MTKLKYFYHEHLAGYGRMKAQDMMTWGQSQGSSDDFDSFSSKSFLEETLPRLELRTDARVLELGCGTGQGACFLAMQGFRVHGIDVIPDAIDKAREISAERGLSIQYEVMDVCKIPQQGEAYDLIVDSYCTQGIVTDLDRASMFAGIKSRLARNGYFLLSCCVLEPERINPDVQVIDSVTERVFIGFDNNDLWDEESETMYSRFHPDPLRPEVGPEDYEGTLRINGAWYIHRRRYRTPETLRLELEGHGFKVLEQSGKVTDNAICVHQTWLYERKEQDKTLRAPKLAKEIEKKFGVVLSSGHINYLLRKRGLTAPPGRPYKDPPAEQEEE